MSRRLRPHWPFLFACFFAAPALAAPDATPAPRLGGGVLQIPGFPPIPLPPGARAFGPGGPNGPGVVDEPAPRDREIRPRAGQGPVDADDEPARRPRAAKPPNRIAPHSVPTVQAQRARVLDDLFARLKAAADDEDAKAVAGAIERVWLRSGSDTADLLMGRAVAALAGRDAKTAESLLDSVVEIEPDWAEGWRQRATVRFLANDIDGAMADIDHTLKLEPRHFSALAGLGAILQKAGFDKRALEAYRHALEIYPQQPEIRKAVEKLQIEVEGRDI